MKNSLLSLDTLLLAQAVVTSIFRQTRTSTSHARRRYDLAVREADSIYPGSENRLRRRAHYAAAGQALRHASAVAIDSLHSVESLRLLTRGQKQRVSLR